MAYQIVEFLTTLSDLQGHASNAGLGLLKCNFLYSSAAVDKNATDMVSSTVPLR